MFQNEPLVLTHQETQVVFSLTTCIIPLTSLSRQINSCRFLVFKCLHFVICGRNLIVRKNQRAANSFDVFSMFQLIVPHNHCPDFSNWGLNLKFFGFSGLFDLHFPFFTCIGLLIVRKCQNDLNIDKSSYSNIILRLYQLDLLDHNQV